MLTIVLVILEGTIQAVMEMDLEAILHHLVPVVTMMNFYVDGVWFGLVRSRIN
jgi:hypothetical protein